MTDGLLRRRVPRFLLGVALCSGSVFLASTGVWSAEKAPSFTANALLDGQEFSLSQYLGKVPILLDFGSIYCSSCVTSIPHLITLQNKYGTEKLKVVGVNLDTYGIMRVRRFFSTFEKNLSFPIIPDLDLKISRSYAVNTLPSYVLVSKEGNVVATFIGYDDETGKRLDEAVHKVVEEEGYKGEELPSTQDVAILSPDNFTKTLQDSVTIVGLTGGREGPFTLRLNGGSEKTAKSVGKMFSVRTMLSLGSNFIEIRYPKGEGQASLALVMFREPLMGEGLQVAFPLFQFHTPDREARCSKCHEMDAKIDEASAASSQRDFCLKCHEYLVSGAEYVHGPVTVGGCNPCHDFASKPHKYEFLAQGSSLCFTCHDDIRSKFAKPFLHGPVAMGLCVVCHSPHGSSFKYQIRMAQGDLCLSCHDAMKSKASAFVQHTPFKNGRCTGCHDPHASDSANQFLKANGTAVCALCHSEKTGMDRHKHPVGKAPKFTVKGMKLDAAGNLNCFSCHDPHSSDNDKMSPVAGGCEGCHASL